MIQYVLAAIVGYLSGSIPFGLLLTRAAGLGDIRSLGSGNIGATNVLRTGSRSIAALTLLLDMLKGFVPVAIATYAWGVEASAIAGIVAFLGHVFPVWLQFRGGKGVATYIGVMGGLSWQLALAFIVVWLAVALVGRRSSLAALTSSAIVAIAAWFIVPGLVAATFLVLSIAVFITHRENLARLVRGEEPVIELRRKAQ